MLSAGFDYVPRQPEGTVLYRAVAGERESFLATQPERDRPSSKVRGGRVPVISGVRDIGPRFVRVRCRVSIGAPWKRRSMLAPIGLADERVLNNEQVKKYNGTKCCASHPPPLASDDVALC